MADIITRADYVAVAQAIGNAVAPLATVADYYLEAATAILVANDFDVELDLLRPFHNAYLSATTIYSATPSTAIEAVRTLQEHIVKRSTEQDVIDWCKAQTPAITVSELSTEFCTVSAAAGYPLAYADVSTAAQLAGDYLDA